MTSAHNIDPMYNSLSYEAPFLLEKLLKDQIAETLDEARALFQEVKRYILLAQVDESATAWAMNSLRVDEAWHQFVLFTREYTDYCQRFFHRYIHHNPSNAPRLITDRHGKESSSFDRFRERYERFFGAPLPEVWYDKKSVTIRRRVINHDAGQCTLREEGSMVDLLDANGKLRLSVNDLAREAIAFIARTGAFYVRELPGDLSDEEKIAIIATLVEYKLLRVAS